MGFPADSQQRRCDVVRHRLLAPDPLQVNPAAAVLGDPGHRVRDTLRAVPFQIERIKQAFGGTPDDRARDDLFKKGPVNDRFDVVFQSGGEYLEIFLSAAADIVREPKPCVFMLCQVGLCEFLLRRVLLNPLLLTGGSGFPV